MGTLVSLSFLEARERKSDADTPRDKGGQVTVGTVVSLTLLEAGE